MMRLPFDLPIAVFELTFRARGPVTLPAFLPGFWRSVFGRACHVLEQLGRFEKTPPRASALFAMLFGDGEASLQPRPYVIRSAVMADRATFEPGAPLRFELVLIGPAIAQARCFIQAFVLAGELGLGTERQEAVLEQLSCLVPGAEAWQDLAIDATAFDTIKGATPTPIYDPPGTVELVLWSPLALKRDGKVLPPEKISAPTLLRNILRRARSLAVLSDPSLAGFPLRDLEVLADLTSFTERKFEKSKHIRHSQFEDSYALEGAIGRAELDLGAAPELWSWLVLVPWIHAGRGTAMGSGGISLYHPDGHPIG